MSHDAPETSVERYRRLRAERLAGPPAFLEPTPPLGEDMLWRGLTRAGEMRILVARTTAATRAATERLCCSDDVARLVGELMTAALLVRSTLHPGYQLQISIENQGSAGRLLADVFAAEEGMRATVANRRAIAERDGALLAGGIVHVSRSRGQREPYRSSTLVESGIGSTMMEYLLGSEQILSHLHLEVAVAGGVVTEAVGFLVQAMPEGSRADLERLVHNLEGLPSLAGAMSDVDPDGRGFAERVLAGFRWDQCARERVAFSCRCSRERVLALLSCLPESDLADLVSSGEPAETTCEFCRQVYRTALPDLMGLLKPGH